MLTLHYWRNSNTVLTNVFCANDKNTLLKWSKGFKALFSISQENEHFLLEKNGMMSRRRDYGV